MSKIILDCDKMRYRDSGLHHYCLNLGLYVQKIFEKERKDSISFYVPRSEVNTFGPGADCIVEKKWHRKLFMPFLRNCDIWHAPFQSGKIVPMNNERIKVLLTVHDLNPVHEDWAEPKLRENLKRTQKLIDRADSIVCISNHTKNDVLKYLDPGTTPIHVIHNGTHHVNMPPSRPSGFTPSRPFLFTLGYLNKKKNFHTLVPLLTGNNFELVVAGKIDEPDYAAAMIETARKLGVEDRLHILGPVAEPDKAWYFQHCEAFFLPSLAEGFGAPVVEAMAFGKPVFLSNRTSLPEIGGDVCFYFRNFDPDHMKEVFNEGIKNYHQQNLKEKIISRGAEFSWEKSARQYVDVYHSLV